MEINNLDERLAKDTFYMGRLAGCVLLLHKNALYPWFILVPDTDEIEFYRLPQAMQLSLIEQVSRLSDFIAKNFKIEKINVATIGNVVSQLHIHVIGRSSTDACWPGVVWGQQAFKGYEEEELDMIRKNLEVFYKDKVVMD